MNSVWCLIGACYLTEHVCTHTCTHTHVYVCLRTRTCTHTHTPPPPTHTHRNKDSISSYSISVYLRHKNGKLELDFESDSSDIRNPEAHEVDLTSVYHRTMQVETSEYMRSLRVSVVLISWFVCLCVFYLRIHINNLYICVVSRVWPVSCFLIIIDWTYKCKYGLKMFFSWIPEINTKLCELVCVRYCLA